jgi:hypothetical protein
MTDEIVPPDIKDFILANIDSIAQLEALLLLRANAGRQWDAGAVAQRLYVGQHEGQDILTRLSAQGLISHQDGSYSYGPAPDTAALIDRLALVYARHLIPITSIIHQRPGRIQEFADAFKLKRKP